MARVSIKDVGAFTNESKATIEAALSAVEVATKVVGSAGTPGQLAGDGTYLYLCTAANTWVRFAATSW